MTKEGNIQTEILMDMSKAGSTVFRQNVGKGWVGRSEVFRKVTRRMETFNPGDVLIRNARVLHAGLCVGSSDVIGWTPVTITADMVGQTVAVFTAVEVKTATGKPSEEQERFIAAVQRRGGRAGIARTGAEAVAIARGPAGLPSG